jgi:hypothetical protein
MRVDSMARHTRRTAVVAVAVGAVWVCVYAHVVVFETSRTGAAPCFPGGGWLVECYYGIPNANALNLLTAEAYVATHSPTFTFHADDFDWPAGPNMAYPDSTFATMGDFLDGHVSDFSEPNAVNLPMANFLLRAAGEIDIRIEDTIFPTQAPRVWLNVGMTTFDGGRVEMGGQTIFRVVTPYIASFGWENAIFQRAGAYPVVVTYFQRSDPNTPMAGVELVSCHGPGTTGSDLPSASSLPCIIGSTIGTPSRLIYATEDILPVDPGDFEADSDFDMQDYARMQVCMTGPEAEGPLTQACQLFDADANNTVDEIDLTAVLQNMAGPCIVEQ